MPSPRQLPSQDTLPYLLLTLTAISGEFPNSLVIRLPGGASYKENVVKQLKRDKLLRTYYRDGRRGLRLTASAKSLLLAQQPVQFKLHLTGNAETNALKSEISRRLRLHRMAEVLVLMLNAGIDIFATEKPPLFSPTPPIAGFHLDRSAYYSSREIKELGAQAIKIRGSRSTGVLLSDGGIFAVYNTASSLMKWDYKAEMRLKALLQTELCLRRLPAQFQHTVLQGIVFGDNIDTLYSLMTNTVAAKRNYFMLDGNYDAFHYLTNDHRGEVILQLLCHPEQRSVLDAILCENLFAKKPGWVIEHDAIDENGAPVLFAYTCDMPRIQRYDTALDLQGRDGTLVCFDFQEPVLHRICSQRITLQSIDFEAYERSVFHRSDPQ